ncbi:MAG: hypothetical protein ACYTG7_11850 [Planctomycetota bacterium]
MERKTFKTGIGIEITMVHPASEGSQTILARFHQEFLDAVAPAFEGITEHCEAHATHAADALCPECGKLFCWNCMAFEARGETLLCRSCAEQKEQKDSRASMFRLARMPFVYVLLIVAAAFIAYTSGVGNPSVAKMEADDLGKPWHLQRAPILWLQQAVRARDRADHLRTNHGNPEMKTLWADIAHTSFAKARISWAGAKPEWDLAIGEAVALANCGDPDSAHDVLMGISSSIGRAHPGYMAYLFHRGNIALQCNDKESAFTDWAEVLDRSRGEFSAMMRQNMSRLERLMTGDLEENNLYLWIREECDTLMPASATRRRIEKIIEKNDLEDEFNQAMMLRHGNGNWGNYR